MICEKLTGPELSMFGGLWDVSEAIKGETVGERSSGWKEGKSTRKF